MGGDYACHNCITSAHSRSAVSYFCQNGTLLHSIVELLVLTRDLTQGNVSTHLRQQATPMAFGLVAIISFDAVDMFFVSQLGDMPLAALAFCFPVLWLLISVIIGFEAGAVSVISRAIGRGNEQLARRQTTDTVMLAGLVMVAIMIVGLFTIDPVFRGLGATDEIMPLVHDYMSIWYWSVPVNAVCWICLASMRARGNSMLEGKIITLAAVVNVILDPIMIFGLFGFPRLEMAGAALATLTSNLIVMVGTLSYLHFKLRVFATPFAKLSVMLQSWLEMLRIGGPAMLTNTVVPIANGIVVAIIAGFGVTAVAGFGVGIRIEPLVLIPFYAMSAVASPFMGQNFAAGKLNRMLHARRVIAKFCLVYGLLLTVVLYVLAPYLASLFSDTAEIQEVAVTYLRIMAVSYAGYGMVMSACAGFNGMGFPLPGVAVSVCRALIVFLPLALLLKWWLGLNGLFIAGATANIIIGLGAYIWLGRYIRGHRCEEAHQQLY
ncbi:MATE family efflux transporter [Candidatus Nitrotoga sp. M5]|nr:MATE family efflux transporter [Candidatus Nitrotoga sp. M5]